MRYSLKARGIDLAIWGAVALVVALGGYLAWSVWAHGRAVDSSTPALRAARSMEQLVRKNPNDVQMRLRLAQLYTIAGRDRQAIEQYEVALKLHKDDVPALSGLGFIASRQKEWKTAEGYWLKVVGLLRDKPGSDTDRRLETAYFYLGTSMYEENRYEDAIGYFKEALRIRRDASDTYYALAQAYRAIDAPAQYRQNLEAALAFDPKMPEANYDFGKVLLAEGDVAKAAEHFRTSADGAPTGVDKPGLALEQLGTAEEHLAKARSLEKKDARKALTEARIATALDPTRIDGLLLKASLYEATKQKSKALETYEAALKIKPDDATARKALERLGAK